MNKGDKLRIKLLKGEGLNNWSFSDAQMLLKHLGFELERISGSHYQYRHAQSRAKQNIQNHRGKAKAYQLRQIRDTIKEHGL